MRMRNRVLRNSSYVFASFSPRLGLPIAIVTAIAAGGCSSDVSRFAYDTAGHAPNAPVIVEKPRKPASGATVAAVTARPLGPASDNGYDRSAVAAGQFDTDGSDGVVQSAGRMSGTSDFSDSFDKPVIVEPGDTLYSIARRNNVPLADLAAANNMDDPARLQAGQRLIVPASSLSDDVLPQSDSEPLYTATAAEHSAGKMQVALATPSPKPHNLAAFTGAAKMQAPAPLNGSGPSGKYVVVAGDTAYGIARRHNLTVSQLAKLNGLSDPTFLRVGRTLLVRGHAQIVNSATAERPAKALANANTSSANARKTAMVSDRAPGKPGKPGKPDRTKNVSMATDGRREGDKVVVRSASTVDKDRRVSTDKRKSLAAKAGDSPDAAVVRKSEDPQSRLALFRWPVRGRIISAFGKQPNANKNDGINIAVPPGTSVKAAKEGTVVYAGTELKTFGKLILIRHSDGWVSAYGHNEELHVKRGDTVKRGQTIATAGSTGAVSVPQVHFELRRSMKPVDPLKYLSPV